MDMYDKLVRFLERRKDLKTKLILVDKQIDTILKVHNEHKKNVNVASSEINSQQKQVKQVPCGDIGLSNNSSESQTSPDNVGVNSADCVKNSKPKDI